LIAVDYPTRDDFASVVPTSMRHFEVCRDFYVELWANRPDAGADYNLAEGLAAVYADLMFDPLLLSAQEIIPSAVFDTLSSGEIDWKGGLVWAVGGCARFGEVQLGIDPAWVRVATLKMHAVAPGSVRVTIDSAGDVHGVSLLGRFGNVGVSEIEFKGLDLEIYEQSDRIKRARRLR
jgi:hypothetical protein